MARKKIIAGAVIAVAGAAIAFPAAAAPTATTPAPPSARLMLSVTDSVGHTDVSSLRCNPVGGSHPRAEAACSTLAQYQGDFGALNVQPGAACTLQYDPVTVRAYGLWDDEWVDHTLTYGNACQLAVETGSVFALS